MSNLSHLAFIFIGGGLGACFRHYLDGFIAKTIRSGLWPWGTFIVNMAGCFLIGLLLAWLLRQRESASWVWPLAATGFLGGFTTFSTFCLQLTEQYLDKQWGWAVAYGLGSVIAGFLLVLAGYCLLKS